MDICPLSPGFTQEGYQEGYNFDGHVFGSSILDTSLHFCLFGSILILTSDVDHVVNFDAAIN